MPDPQPPYLADALARFRAAADSAVEHGRRVVDQARESGAAFDRETSRLADQLRRGEPGGERGSERTPTDLSAAATEYRKSQGLPIPDLTPLEPAAAPPPPDDEDFSDLRIMRKL